MELLNIGQIFKNYFRAVRGIFLTPIILSRILIRLHLLFKFENKNHLLDSISRNLKTSLLNKNFGSSLNVMKH